MGAEYLGSLQFDLADELKKLPKDCRRAVWDVTLPLTEVPPHKGSSEVPPSTVTLHIEFVPYEYDF
jgi:hypothetical protein